jgi:DNA-binding transcriptional LysR family regulator
MNPDDQLAAFDEGTLGLGLSRPLPPDRRPCFEEEAVYVDYLGAVLPPKHPLTEEKEIKLEKLASEPFVLFHRVGAPGLLDLRARPETHFWIFCGPKNQPSRNRWPLFARRGA